MQSLNDSWYKHPKKKSPVSWKDSGISGEDSAINDTHLSAYLHKQQQSIQGRTWGMKEACPVTQNFFHEAMTKGLAPNQGFFEYQPKRPEMQPSNHTGYQKNVPCNHIGYQCTQ